MEKSTNTQLAVQNGLIGKILSPADFKALDGLIQSLGDKSANLSETEKAGAVAVIDEWNQSVTARIKLNAEQAKSVLDFLNGAGMYGETLKDVIELFHEALGDTPEYLAYQKAVDGYAAVQMDEPVDVPATADMTVAQADRIRAENYAATLAHSRKVKSAEYAFNKAVKAYVQSLAAMPEVQSLKGALNSYKNKAARLAAECADKATRAKLNVTIGDPEVRRLLHELMDFAKGV